MNPLHAIRDLRGAERGAALPLALLGLLMISVLGFTLVTLGTTEVTVSTNWKAYSTAFYGAETGIASGATQLRNLLGQTPNPNLAQITAPTLSDPNLKLATFSVTQLNLTPYQTTLTVPQYAGLSGIVTDYLITSQVTGAGGTQANLTQVFKYVQIPLFQFGVFYGKGVDLEIEPGPAMTLNGKVFSNSNIYVGADNSLTIQQSMKTAGKIYRTVKSSSGANPTSYTFGAGSPANPNIADASGTLQTLNFDSTYQPGGTSKWASATDWMNKATSTFGGQVQDGSMGVTQITPPIPGSFNNSTNPDVVAHQLIEMPKAGDSTDVLQAKLYTQAGLRIIDGAATDQNGSSVTLPSGAVTTTSFCDAREGKTVNVIQVDVGALNPAKPKNGLVYIASTAAPTITATPCAPGAPTGGTMPAVRLVNGSDLSNKGLTVVSQNPIYIQGDYNTKTYGTFKDPVTGNPTHPPAAVIGDAVTVLSNNWAPNNSDSKGDQVTSNRPGSATTVNAALMTGPSAESTLSNGNGQLENDIRFLEDWGGATFTYSGSIVSLWHSLQAAAPWRCCGSAAGQYYSPPTRNWSYDTLFNANTPPGTPSGIIMLKGPWSQS